MQTNVEARLPTISWSAEGQPAWPRPVCAALACSFHYPTHTLTRPHHFALALIMGRKAVRRSTPAVALASVPTDAPPAGAAMTTCRRCSASCSSSSWAQVSLILPSEAGQSAHHAPRCAATCRVDGDSAGRHLAVGPKGLPSFCRRHLLARPLRKHRELSSPTPLPLPAVPLPCRRPPPPLDAHC